jgi:3-oxoacyl-[acyl-carrier protein] reductase
MDGGIKGNWALVCAASKRLGCARALVQEGVQVLMAAPLQARFSPSCAAVHFVAPCSAQPIPIHP